MRIITGKFKGRRLALPSSTTTRPTMDRVRESLFSMLHTMLGSFEDIVILDAFAGSGSLGLEALSRGARKCYFCESNATVRRILQQNIQHLLSTQEINDKIVIGNDVFKIKTIDSIPDIIFLDPPYGLDLELKAIDHFMSCGFIFDKTIIVMETDKTNIPQSFINLNKIDERIFGNCALSFWQLSRCAIN